MVPLAIASTEVQLPISEMFLEVGGFFDYKDRRGRLPWSSQSHAECFG